MNKASPDYLDVVKLLVKNFQEGKPLLEDAVLFRGSKFGDNLPGPNTPDQLHAHLLPQVAAGYTHNWSKSEAFIDTYPIDRDKTRFYANQSLEEHLKGKPVTSYSVPDVERAIRPLVENIAYLPPGQGRDRNIANLERLIKSSFYEAGVPVNALEGSANAKNEKFYYTGQPRVDSNQKVIDQLVKLTPENESRAKGAYALKRAPQVVATIDKLEAFHPEAARAFQTLRGAVQRDHAVNLMAKHGDKPLAEFIRAALVEPPRENQSRVLRLAQGLAASLDSMDPNVRARALTVTKQLEQLDPRSATLKDVGLAIVKVNQSLREANHTDLGRPSEKMPSPGIKPPSATFERSMSR